MLTASHLTRRFDTRVAVEDVSFELAPGEIFALLGPNGAGKTTTLRILAGLIRPTSGGVRIGGEVMTRTSAPRLRGTIGFLTETPGLWDRLTVRENLMAYARLHGLAQPSRAVERALALFEMSDRAAQPAAQLSKGLRQRVAIARTLIHDPRIVLLDEPTSGLDPASALGVRELILRLRTEQRAVLVCTHNLDEVERIADRVAVIRTRLVAVDTPESLRRRLFGARVRITLVGDAEPFAAILRTRTGAEMTAEGASLLVETGSGRPAVPLLVQQLVEAGAAIEAVVPETPPLEQVYLRLLDEEAAER